MSDFNIEVRKKQLQSLDQFISSSQDRVQSVLDFLGWKASHILKDDGLVKCSIDQDHRIPQRCFDKHIEKCSFKKEGYNLDEKFLSEPLNDTKYSIAIDHQKKHEILSNAHKRHSNFATGWNGQDPDPKTSDRLTTTYTSYERLALYDYAAANTSAPVQLPEFDISIVKPKTEQPLTYEEQLALERNAKRRRIKYKSIHTSKKNYVEVMREVIDGQMELYKEWVEEKDFPKQQSEEDVDYKISLLQSEACVKQNDSVDYSSENVSEYDLDRSIASRNSTHSGSSRSTSRKREQSYESLYKRHKHYHHHNHDSRREDNRKTYKKHEHHHYKSHHRTSYYKSNHHSEKSYRYKEKGRLDK